MTRMIKRLPLVLCLLLPALGGVDGNGCESEHSNGPLPTTPVAASGVQKMTVKVDTNAAGHTVEQENIAERYKMDNTPGAIKWLYVVSPMSGDVILASSVKGKVTSSGKRLTPKTVAAGQSAVSGGQSSGWVVPYGAGVSIAGQGLVTGEVIQDDGTYGDSGEYLFWWDQRGQYHQQYLSADVMIHISDKPMHWSKVLLNLDAVIRTDK